MFLICATRGPLGATINDLPEVARALRDLEELKLRPPNTSEVYWQTIKDKLLSESVSKELKEAIKEWSRKGAPFRDEGSTCELCGKHPITWNFPILNKGRKKTLLIGSECIVNFLHISFKTDLSSLESLINRQIKELRRRQVGLKTRGIGQSEGDELVALEAAIREFLQAAGTGDDFPIIQHMYALNEPIRMLNMLDMRTPAKEAGNKALEGCLAIRRIAQKNGLTVTDHTGVMDVVKAVISRRNNRERKAHLQEIRAALTKVFQGRAPSDVVVRIYEDLDGYRARFVDTARAQADAMKSKAREKYAPYLTFTDRYDHLHFLVDAGVAAIRDGYDRLLADFEKAATSKGFLEKVVGTTGLPTGALDPKKRFPEPEMVNFPDKRTRWASAVVDFLHDVQRGDWKPLVQVVEATFGRKVTDEQGVVAALLQAADDSLIVPEETGARAIEEFGDLVEVKSPGVVRLLLKEVDDLADMKFGEAKLFDRMSQDLGFDVEDTLRYFDANDPTDLRLCRRLLAEWQAGKRPSGDELRLFLTRKAERPERPKRSMLDQLKTDVGSDVGWVIKQAALVWAGRAA
jgi:hypothetical protein